MSVLFTVGSQRWAQRPAHSWPSAGPGEQMDGIAENMERDEAEEGLGGNERCARTRGIWEQNSKSSEYPTMPRGSWGHLWKTKAMGSNPASTTH